MLAFEQVYFSSSPREHKPSSGSSMQVLLPFHLSLIFPHRASDRSWLIKRKQKPNSRANWITEHIRVPCQRAAAQEWQSSSRGSSQRLFHMSKQKMLIGAYKSGIWAGLCHRHFPVLQHWLKELQEVRKGYHTEIAIQNSSLLGWFFFLRAASYHN